MSDQDQKPDSSDWISTGIVTLAILVLVILFAKEPDLMDAIIERVRK